MCGDSDTTHSDKLPLTGTRRISSTTRHTRSLQLSRPLSLSLPPHARVSFDPLDSRTPLPESLMPWTVTPTLSRQSRYRYPPSLGMLASTGWRSSDRTRIHGGHATPPIVSFVPSGFSFNIYPSSSQTCKSMSISAHSDEDRVISVTGLFLGPAQNTVPHRPLPPLPLSPATVHSVRLGI